jgi:hypothetical protein
VSALRRAALVVLVLGLVACRAPAPLPDWPRTLPSVLEQEGVEVGSVEVVADDALSATDWARIEADEADRVVRQTILDWLDYKGHWAPGAGLAIRVRIREFRLRSAARARVLEGLGGGDRLVAGVTVLRGPETIKAYATGVDSSVGGREWFGSSERLRRMARILGVRVVEGL